MSEDEKDPIEVVLEFRVTDVMYEKAPQELFLARCVKSIFISKFYGPFSIYDPSGRLLGTSNDGSIPFNGKALQTEEAKIWFESIAGYSEEYKFLKDKVDDLGLCFSHIDGVTIRFEDAPAIEDDSGRRFFHIPVFYTVHNAWNTETKTLVYQ